MGSIWNEKELTGLKLLKENLTFIGAWSVDGVVVLFSTALSGETVGGSMK